VSRWLTRFLKNQTTVGAILALVVVALETLLGDDG